MRRRAALAAAAASVAGIAAHTPRIVDPSPAVAAPDPAGDTAARVFTAEPSRAAPTPPPPTTTTPTVAPAPPPTLPAPAGRDLGVFVATCYDLTGPTASGRPAGPGSIAVDPRVIPLGTRLHVDGWGTGVADDTGGAIVGRRVDLWEPTAAACTAWGRRPVHVENAA